MRQVVSYKRLKTMKNVKPFAPMQRVVAVNRLRKARGPGGGGTWVMLGLIFLGMCRWPLRAPTH